MASIIFTAKDIFDQDFKREVRGYNKDEVNEFLDDPWFLPFQPHLLL